MSQLKPDGLATSLQTLQELGLTASEAKAYVAIIKLGLCTAAQVARKAELQRSEIYRLVLSLVSLGLVEETLDKPKRYRAIDVQKAILVLSENVTNKLRTIAAESKPLAKHLETLKPRAEPRVDQPYLHLVRGRDDIRKSFVEALASAQKESWVIVGNRSALTSNPGTRRILATLTSKHLKMRAIIPIDGNSMRDAKRLASVIEIRHHPPLGVNIYGIDNQQVAVGLLSPNQRNPKDRVKFIVNYPDYVGTMKELFETVWNQSVPLHTEIASIKSGRRIKPRARVIWGREEIFNQIARSQLRTIHGMSEITTLNGPVRIIRRMEKGISTPRGKEIAWRVLCHVNPQNIAEVKKLRSIAEVRHVNRPFGIGIIIFDSSEALIHYIDPDSPDLAATAADVAMDTTDPSVVKNLLQMFDSVWQNAIPIDKKLRKLTRRRLSSA